jgi:Sel1 repeat/Putative peptidoglycan binding domain
MTAPTAMPRSPKGASPEARLAAETEAHAAGLTSGEWRGGVIRATAAGERAAAPGDGLIERAIRRAATRPEPDSGGVAFYQPGAAESPEDAAAFVADPPPFPFSQPLAAAADEAPLGHTLADPAVALSRARRRGRLPRILAGSVLAAGLVALLAGAGAWFDAALTPPSHPSASAPPPAMPDAGERPSDMSPLPPDALQRAAESGDVRAQYDLGVRLAAGRGRARDAAAAAQWFERAAVRGLAPAQYNLGVMYDRGLGVARNASLAFFWYESAAEQGYAKAEHNLATAYADGRGTPRDLEAAARWFARAAKAGLAPSQHALATMHERGIGVARDPARARELYRAAAAQGDADAAKKLAALGTAKLDAIAPAAGLPPAPSRATILDIQRLLKRFRFDPGPPDGAPGPRTRQAISLFERFAGRPATGEPSAALLAELRAVAADMGGQP